MVEGDCRGWQQRRQPQQRTSPRAASLDEKSRERVRRSIEYLRQTSQFGPENGSAAYLSWKRAHSSTMAAAPDRYAARAPILIQQQVREPMSGGDLYNGSRYNHRGVDYVDKQAADEHKQLEQRRQEALREMQQQRPWAERHRWGRLLLIIDVQSRRGAVEEVSCHEGDNCFDLARGFIIRRVAPVVVQAQ